MNHLTFFLCLLAMCLLSTGSKAQALREVGSYQALDAASQETTGFCVGVIENKGFKAPGSMGHTYYSRMTIKVYYHLLKGVFPTRDCGYSVMDINIPGKTEDEPTIGKPYLMIGIIEGTRFNIRKLAEPTLENIETVLRVLRQRGLEVNSVKYNPSVIEITPQPSDSRVSLVSHKPAPSSKPQPFSQSLPNNATEPMKTATTPWSTIAVLIVAACGLLWVLLKRRL